MSKKKQTLRQLNVTLPRKWGELTAKQVTRLAYYIGLGLEQNEYLVRAGLEFACLKPIGATTDGKGALLYSYYHPEHGNIFLSAEHINAIARALSWTLGEPEPMEAPAIEAFQAPSSRINDFTLERYVAADTSFGMYLQSRDYKFMEILCAVAYYQGEYDPGKVDYMVRKISVLPGYCLDAILLWFTGVKKMLQGKYPHVFSSSGNNGEPVGGQELLTMLVSSLNDGRIVDNRAIKKAPVHEALYELEQKYIAAEKLNSKRK